MSDRILFFFDAPITYYEINFFLKLLASLGYWEVAINLEMFQIYEDVCELLGNARRHTDNMWIVRV